MTPQSSRYLTSITLRGRQPGTLHVYTTKKGGYAFSITWQVINPPYPHTSRKTFGPYTNLFEGVNASLKWFYSTLNKTVPDG